MVPMTDWLVSKSAWSVIWSFYHHIPSLWCGCEAMNGLNSLLDSRFLQESAHRNLSEINFLANSRSLLDVIEWLVGIQECLECHLILLPPCNKPLMWLWSYDLDAASWTLHQYWVIIFLGTPYKYKCINFSNERLQLPCGGNPLSKIG